MMLQPELQDVRLALRLAEKLSGCRTLAVSRASLTAEALRLQLGIPLQVLHGGLRKRLVRSILRRGKRIGEPELRAIAAGGVRQVRSALPLAKDLGGITGAVAEMEIEREIGIGRAASVGLFECH